MDNNNNSNSSRKRKADEDDNSLVSDKGNLSIESASSGSSSRAGPGSPPLHKKKTCARVEFDYIGNDVKNKRAIFSEKHGILFLKNVNDYEISFKVSTKVQVADCHFCVVNNDENKTEQKLDFTCSTQRPLMDKDGNVMGTIVNGWLHTTDVNIGRVFVAVEGVASNVYFKTKKLTDCIFLVDAITFESVFTNANQVEKDMYIIGEQLGGVGGEGVVHKCYLIPQTSTGNNTFAMKRYKDKLFKQRNLDEGINLIREKFDMTRKVYDGSGESKYVPKPFKFYEQVDLKPFYHPCCFSTDERTKAVTFFSDQLITGKVVEIYEHIEGHDLLTVVIKNCFQWYDGRKIIKISKMVEVNHVVKQILEILYALHTQFGITHRDLTPENFIIRPDLKVVVIDFGLAVDRLSDIHGMCGKSFYNPPVLVRLMRCMRALKGFKLDDILYDSKVDNFMVGQSLYTLAMKLMPIPSNQPQAADCREKSFQKMPSHLNCLFTIIKGLVEREASERWTAERALRCLANNGVDMPKSEANVEEMEVSEGEEIVSEDDMSIFGGAGLLMQMQDLC